MLLKNVGLCLTNAVGAEIISNFAFDETQAFAYIALIVRCAAYGGSERQYP